MAENFEIGEIAVLHGCRNTERNGVEVEILATPKPYRWRCPLDRKFVPAGYYSLRDCTGYLSMALPEKLRKKRRPPKRETVGEWELCPWQPRSAVTVRPSQSVK